MWSGVWGRDESEFGDWSSSLSHVLVDLKRLYSTDRAFSSTLRATTFRCICACAAGEKLKLDHFDVTSAFTQADLDDVDLYLCATC